MDALFLTPYNRTMPTLFYSILANADEGGIASFGFIALFVAFIGGVFFFARKQAKKRTGEMKQIAASLDMSFNAETHKPIDLGLSGMYLFKKGRSHKIKNLIQGTFVDTDCMLFDYQYTTGSGKNSSTHRQTVVAFKICGTQLPKFTCKPEHFFHKFADLFGHADINFEENPVFSKKYRLNGDDENAVRTIFNESVISHLEAESDQPWSVDGKGEWLVIHRAGIKVKTEDCSQFLLDATTLLNAMTLS